VSLRRELLVALGVILVGWIVLMVALARWQRGKAGEKTWSEPELVHYPGAESAPEQTVPNLGIRRYWFHLSEDYPSQSVFGFYRKMLEAEGWRRVGENPPTWVRRQSKDEIWDGFDASWTDPKGLFQLDLQMVSQVRLARHEGSEPTERREPGIEVFVTQRRALFPGFALPPQRSAPPRREIEVR